jgi:hypothetical protein
VRHDAGALVKRQAVKKRKTLLLSVSASQFERVEIPAKLDTQIQNAEREFPTQGKMTAELRVS